jgi:LmbE family N-acetylglucosaminyl deacetylase
VVEEAKRVAAALGYETRFLPYFSKELPIDREVQDVLREELRTFRADTLFLPFLCDDHDDHRRASHVLWLAHRRLPLPSVEVWAYQVYTALLANVVSDISAVAEAKRQAIRTWASQAGSRDWAHFALGLNAFNSRFLPPGAGERHAETFFVVPLNDYCDLCASYFADAGKCYYSEGYADA